LSKGEWSAGLADNRNQHVLAVLKDVAHQLRLLKTVADAEIDEKVK
jgi:hypothetical protein